MSRDAADQTAARVDTLLAVSREIGATLDLDALLRRIESAALETLDCERVSVFLYDDEEDELYGELSTGEEEIRFPADRGIAGEAFRSREVVNVADAYDDPRFNREIDRQTGFRTRSLLSFPMIGFDGDVVGVLQVLNKRGGPFERSDEEVASILGSLTGVALQRQMLLQEYTEKQKLLRDLAVAREIQQTLLPEADPVIDGFDVAGWNRPADETGGDCYDFVELGDGRLGLLLADATGHGIGPALLVSECSALIQGLVSVCDDLGTVITRANAVLYEDTDAGRFVTACFGVLDPAASTIEYVSAGHGPLLFYCRETGEGRLLQPTTIPLGIAPEAEGTPAEPLVLEPGDAFLLVTDGFFEWENGDGEAFGTERIFDVVRERPDAAAAELIRELTRAVEEFSGGTPQADDLTAVVVLRS